MSDQSYDEGTILQEIIAARESGAKSHAQIVRDLTARGVPTIEIERLMKVVAKELNPEADNATNYLIDYEPTTTGGFGYSQLLVGIGIFFSCFWILVLLWSVTSRYGDDVLSICPVGIFMLGLPRLALSLHILQASRLVPNQQSLTFLLVSIVVIEIVLSCLVLSLGVFVFQFCGNCNPSN